MSKFQSPISEFCEERGIPVNIKIAFSAYVRSVYADKFLLRGDTDTVRIMVGRLTQEQVQDAWLEFTKELARHLKQT